MGYKLAGMDVVGANDIDPKMKNHYVRNHKPKYFFLSSIKDLVGADLPQEILDIDILDGSPPCSSFSMSGLREKAWGKKKHFREGQKTQVLDDLFFDFLDLAERINPKVIIAENVKGMLAGKAKGYLRLIVKRLAGMGYAAQIFLCNSAGFGVPQLRERVFVIASRKDLGLPKLSIVPPKPPSQWVSSGEAFSGLEYFHNDPPRPLSEVRGLAWRKTAPGKTLAGHFKASRGNESFFNHAKLHKDLPCRTICAAGRGVMYHYDEPRNLVVDEMIVLGSFPSDYNFDSPSIGCYMIGMSVPPKMTEGIASQIVDQWF